MHVLSMPYIFSLVAFVQDVKIPRLPACFGNLKNLTVTVDINSKKDLLWMAILLEAAPFLETLQTCVSFCREPTSLILA